MKRKAETKIKAEPIGMKTRKANKDRIPQSLLWNLHSKIVSSINSLNPRTSINCKSDIKGCYDLFKKLYEDIKVIEYKFSDTYYIEVVDKSLDQGLNANLKGIVLNFVMGFTRKPKIVDDDNKAVNIGDIIGGEKVIIFEKGKIQEIPLIDNQIPISILQKLPRGDHFYKGPKELSLSYYSRLSDYVIDPSNPLHSVIVKLIESQVYNNREGKTTVKSNDILDQENKNFTVKSNIYYKDYMMIGILIEWQLDPDFEIYESITDKIELPIDHPLSMLIAPITDEMKSIYLRIGLRDDEGFMLINILYPEPSDWLDDTDEFFTSVDKINDVYDDDAYH